MPIVNLTPHDLVIYDHEGEEIITRIPASGIVARVQTVAEEVGTIIVDGTKVPIVRTKFLQVDAPEPEPDTTYVVSTLCLQALSLSPHNCIAPDTGPDSVVRDDDGHIVGIRRFQRL